MIMVEDVKRLEGAHKIIKVCANLQPDEKVLILTDTKTVRVGELVAIAALGITEDTVLAVFTPRNAHGEEPPSHIASAMRDADVIFMPLTYSMTHASATKEARKNGARIVSMGDFNVHMLEDGGIKADFLAIAKVVDQVAEAFTRGKKVRVATRQGTELRIDISGRSGHSEPGFSHKPGSISSPPNIEANVGPLEGSTEGTLIVDGSIPHPTLGVIIEPISVTVKKGKVVEIDGGIQAEKLRCLLSHMEDRNMYNVAELGIGLNPCSVISGSMLEDEGACGTCHIGIGDNTSFEGSVKAKSHIDLIIREPTIEIDGTIIQENGELKIGNRGSHD